MDMHGYPYPTPYPPSRPPEAEYPDRGDGYGEYYERSTSDDKREFERRASRSAHRNSKRPNRNRSLSATKTISRSRSRYRSKSRPRSRSRSKSRSRSRSGRRSRSSTHTRSSSGNRRDLRYKEPGFLDAFRVLYLTPSKQKQNTTKYLVTKKHQDRVQEILKSDGLGSKRWLFYPRAQSQEIQSEIDEVAGPRDNSDQRVKIDAEFFRKYKRRSKVDSDAPIAKLKRWELILYKKFGFIQAV